MSQLKDQIRSLLVAGQKPVGIASQLGVDPSYISRLLSDETFNAQMTREIAQRAGVRLDIDDLTDGLEVKALSILERQMDGGSFDDKPHLTLAAIKTLGSRTRSTGSQGGATGGGDVTVTINLPNFLNDKAERKVVVNDNNEIVAIDERVLKTINTGSLMGRAERVMEERTKSIQASNAFNALDDDEQKELF